MGKKKDLNLEKKAAISALVKGGKHSLRDIGVIEGVSHCSVLKIEREIRSGRGIPRSNRRNCGANRKISQRIDRRIITTCLQHSNSTFKRIKEILKDEEIDISIRTLKRLCAEAGIKCYRPTKQPRLSEKMRENRLEFAKRHKNLTVDDWKKVLFNDESTLLTLTEIPKFTGRRKNEKFNPDCVQESVKHPASVMVWGEISGTGVGPLYFVEGSMNQTQYLKVLEEVLIPYQISLEQNGTNTTFMQDNAPCHTAKSVKTFMQCNNIHILPWPSNSPDLNPIENVWNVLKTKVYERPNPDKDTLIQNIQQVWHKCPPITECI